MPLKVKTTISQQVDYIDLDQYVQELTGREWSVIAAGEYGNYEQHEFLPNGKPLDEYDAKKMKSFLDFENEYPHPSTMFAWLAANGHIQPGRYVVDIFW